MRPVRTIAVLVAVAALATACSDDGPPEDDPTTSASGSPTESSSPSESASPSAEPATGKALQGPSFKARAPQGWSVRQGGSSAALTTIYAADEEADGNVAGFLRVADGSAFIDDPLPRLAQQRVASGEYPAKKPEVLDNVEVDGVEMYHVAGDVGNGNYVIDLGAIVGDNLVEIHIESDSRTPEELQAVLDSVLASWQWA